MQFRSSLRPLLFPARSARGSTAFSRACSAPGRSQAPAPSVAAPVAPRAPAEDESFPLARSRAQDRRAPQARTGQAAGASSHGRHGAARLRLVRVSVQNLRPGHRVRRGQRPEQVLARRQRNGLKTPRAGQAPHQARQQRVIVLGGDRRSRASPRSVRFGRGPFPRQSLPPRRWSRPAVSTAHHPKRTSATSSSASAAARSPTKSAMPLASIRRIASTWSPASSIVLAARARRKPSPSTAGPPASSMRCVASA